MKNTKSPQANANRRTKSTFKAIQGLHDRFSPAQMHVISDQEADTIRTELELGGRTNLEIQDVRDMAVMMYSQYADLAEKQRGIAAMHAEMDAMSAICAVIDSEKAKRGMDV